LSASYRFAVVAACNMCGAAPERFKVLGTRLNRSQGRSPRQARGAAVTIVRCRDCDLIFPDPQPVPGSVHDHYDMPGEDYWGDSRASPEADPAAVARFSALRARFPADRPPAVLDVGVGSGYTAKAMIAAGFELHGFEPIPQFRDLALQALGVPADRIRLGGIEEVDYSPASFDLVNFGAVLEHLYDPGGSLAKAVRWLRPGGRIVLEVPSSNWLIARLINRFFRLKGTAYVTHCSPMHSPFHLYEFGAKSFAANGARLGYRVEELTIEVGVDPTMPAALQRLLRPVMAATDTGMMLHAVLQKP
jgi:SAM-dependent methyltransferase